MAKRFEEARSFIDRAEAAGVRILPGIEESRPRRPQMRNPAPGLPVHGKAGTAGHLHVVFEISMALWMKAQISGPKGMVGPDVFPVFHSAW